MTRWILLSLGLLSLAPAIHASYPIPTKIDAGVNVRFNVQMGPQAYVPRAPWYTYFPVDPNLLARSPGTTPYPTWPTTFPPAPAPARPVQPASYVPAEAPSYWYGR